MSNKALNWAWDQTLAPAGRKFVLIALADFADEAHSCYPGQKLLAQMTGQSVSSVGRHLDALEADQVIARQARYDDRGHRTSDRYVLAVEGAESLPVKTPTRQNDEETTSQNEGVLPVNLVSPTRQIARGSLSEPLENPQRGAAPRRRSPETPLPEAWVPSQRHIEFARENGIDVQSEAMKFRSHAIANDRRQRQWDATFTTWLLKAREFQVQAAASARPSQWDRAQRVGGGW